MVDTRRRRQKSPKRKRQRVKGPLSIQEIAETLSDTQRMQGLTSSETTKNNRNVKSSESNEAKTKYKLYQSTSLFCKTPRSRLPIKVVRPAQAQDYAWGELIVIDVDGYAQWVCNVCKQAASLREIAPSKGEPFLMPHISNFRVHLLSKHKSYCKRKGYISGGDDDGDDEEDEDEDEEDEDMFDNSSSSDILEEQEQEYSEMDINELICNFLCSYSIDFSIIDSGIFKELVDRLNSNDSFELCTSESLENIILKKAYDRKEQKIMNIIQDVSGFAMVSDAFVSKYCALPVICSGFYWISDFKIQKACMSLEIPFETKEEIVDNWNSIFYRNNIDKKYLHGVVTTGELKYIDDAKTSFIGDLESIGNIHCFCYSLDLIAENIIFKNEENNQLYLKCKKTKKLLKDWDEPFYCTFKRKQNENNITTGIHSLSSSRWNSVYEFFTSFVTNKKALEDAWNEENVGESVKLSEEDWNRLNLLRHILSPLKSSLLSLQADTTPTINRVLVCLFMIIHIWNTKVTNLQVLQEIKNEFYNRFGRFSGDTEWYKNRNLETCILAAALDPTWKKFSFAETHGPEAQNYLLERSIDLLKGKLTAHLKSSAEEKDTDEFTRLIFACHKTANIESEITKYKDIEVTSTSDFDVLEWWKNNSEFTCIKELVPKILCIPACAVILSDSIHNSNSNYYSSTKISQDTILMRSYVELNSGFY